MRENENVSQQKSIWNKMKTKKKIKIKIKINEMKMKTKYFWQIERGKKKLK